jgi:molecular chaperone DnaJ
MRISAAFDWFKSGSLAADSDPYKILGISRRAPADEVKKAYRQLVMIHHPDRGGDSIVVTRINSAYNVIRKKRGI